MTWRERQQWGPEFLAGFRPASFRGVPFQVRELDKGFGRRLAIQEIPGGEFTEDGRRAPPVIVQDLGEDADDFNIDAWLIGDDYDLQRDALERALKTAGQGDLYLPRRGALSVTVVDRPRTIETQDERGFCVVRFRVLVTALPPKVTKAEAALRVQQNAEAAKRVATETFQVAYTGEGLSVDRKLKVREALDGASRGLVNIQGRISSAINIIPRGANEVNRLINRLNRVIDTPLDLSEAIVNAVTTTYSSLVGTASLLRNVATTWGRGGPVRILADQTFRFLDAWRAPSVLTTTVEGQQEQQNLDAFYRLLALLMIFETANVLPGLEFGSRDQVGDFRDRYLRSVDPWYRESVGDEFEAMSSVNEAVLAHLGEMADPLPHIVTYTPPETLPALVIAHNLYGDARMEAEIVERNNLRNPLFVPAGEPLEIVRA